MIDRRLFCWVGAWLLPLCAACGAKTQDGKGTDTSTDWVRECNEDATCDDEEHCACGICTRECETDADCRALSPDAECAEAPSSCQQPRSICVADTSFEWLNDGPAPTPADPEASECVAVIDKAGCCLPVLAVPQSELDANPCLVEAAGADPEQVWQESRACQTPDPCPGVSCAPFAERPQFAQVATTSVDGECGLEPPSDMPDGGVPQSCDDGQCPGAQCDPRVGCNDGLVCAAPDCDTVGTCQTRPDVECGPAYAPVCGCDGVTYGTPCGVVGGPYQHDGECESSPPACDDATCEGGPCDPRVGCGSDLACAATSCDGPGTCVPQMPLDCDVPYEPVCGCDGKTYDNGCDWLRQAIDHEGECEEPAAPCGDATCEGSPCDPRVGCSDGFGCDARECDEPGVCRPLPGVDCDDDYEPVCGCDGKTYENACTAAGRLIDYEGECVTPAE